MIDSQSIVLVLDLDGVLVDTLPGLKTVFQKFLSLYGGTYSEELFQSFNGKTIQEIVVDLKDRHEYSAKPAALQKHYLHLMQEVYESAPLMRGALPTLNICNAWGIPVCIASESKRSQVEKIIERYKLQGLIHSALTADEVSRGKPYPDLFLELKKKFPSKFSFFVFDDSMHGVRAAETAGMTAYHFNPKESNSQKTVENFTQISQILLTVVLRSQKFILANNYAISKKTSWIIENTKAQQFWKNEKKKRSQMFNGPLLIVENLIQENFSLHFNTFVSDYASYLFTKKHWPDEKNILPFYLAVSSILTNTKTEILIGKRADHLSSYPGNWELVASGSVVPEIPPEKQLLSELEEECGLPATEILKTSFLGCCVDSQSSFLDLCFHIQVANPTVLRRTEEYEELQFVSPDQARKIFLQPSVPTSLILLKLYQKSLAIKP